MVPDRVISNSSPLIGLEQIRQIDLLKQLYSTIQIPPAVAREIAPGVTLPDWITVINLTQPVGPQILGASLGAGESEVISLALEVKAQLIILDDLPARRVANVLSIPVIGTLGVLLLSKRQGLIAQVKTYLDELIRFDFRISPKLYEQVLVQAGENNS